MVSELSQLNCMQCGSSGLKKNTSPGLSGILMPTLGKAKYVTTLCASIYPSLVCTVVAQYVYSWSSCAFMYTFTPLAKVL